MSKLAIDILLLVMGSTDQISSLHYYYAPSKFRAFRRFFEIAVKFRRRSISYFYNNYDNDQLLNTYTGWVETLRLMWVVSTIQSSAAISMNHKGLRWPIRIEFVENHTHRKKE